MSRKRSRTVKNDKGIPRKREGESEEAFATRLKFWYAVMSQKAIDIVIIENIIAEDPEYAIRMNLAARLEKLLPKFQTEWGTKWRQRLNKVNATQQLSLNQQKAFIEKHENIEDRANRALSYIVEQSCPICLEDYKKSDILATMPSCKHSFHPKCLKDVMAVDPSCPICRVPFGGADPPAPPSPFWETVAWGRAILLSPWLDE
jgi:hypothetical protein